MALSIETELRAIARSQLDWNDALPTGPLAEHLDSLQLLTLLIAVEDRFEIILEPRDEEAIDTVDDLVQTIRSKRDV